MKEPSDRDIQAAEWFIVAFVKGWSCLTLYGELRSRGLHESKLVPPSTFNKALVRRLIAIQWPALSRWLCDHEGAPDILRIAPQMARLSFIDKKTEARSAAIREEDRIKRATRRDQARNELVSRALSDRRAHGMPQGKLKSLRIR